MKTDKVNALVNEARSIFNATSVHEIIGLDKQAATAILNKTYQKPSEEAIDRYLKVIEKLRW